jgi:hypothetical protein
VERTGSGSFRVRGKPPAGDLWLHVTRGHQPCCEPVPFAAGDSGLRIRCVAVPARMPPVVRVVAPDGGRVQRSTRADRATPAIATRPQ